MFNPYVILGVVAAFLLSNGVTAYKTWSICTAYHDQQTAIERDRIRKESDAALAVSREFAVAIAAERDKALAQLRASDEEANTDLNANRDCLGADSVRRINRAR